MAFPGSPSNGDIYTTANGTIYTYDSTDNKWVIVGSSNPISDEVYGAGWDGVVDVAPSKNALYDRLNNYILLNETQNNNVQGATATAGAWRTRILNTEVIDEPDACSLAANQFTLQAGTYKIFAHATYLAISRNKARLRNITDGTTTLLGESSFGSVGATQGGTAFVVGIFTIASAKTFELQHYPTSTRGSGFGIAANVGVNEIYAQVELWKVA